MKRFLYMMPAILMCMLYALLTILAGGIGGFQPIVLVYIGFPILAAVFLRKGRWWGCLFGIAMGAVLLYMGSQYIGQTIDIERPMGIAFIVYFIVMGLICYKQNNRK